VTSPAAVARPTIAPTEGTIRVVIDKLIEAKGIQKGPDKKEESASETPTQVRLAQMAI
jgi:hypothetical protein